MSDLDPAVYRKAGAIIRRDGLAKRVWHDSEGGHCTVGALMAATCNDLPDMVESYADLLGEMLGYGEGSGAAVVTWNDKAARTDAEVADLFDQAAEKLEADQ